MSDVSCRTGAGSTRTLTERDGGGARPEVKRARDTTPPPIPSTAHRGRHSQLAKTAAAATGISPPDPPRACDTPPQRHSNSTNEPNETHACSSTVAAAAACCLLLDAAAAAVRRPTPSSSPRPILTSALRARVTNNYKFRRKCDHFQVSMHNIS